jgi:branched-chain amino acid transport system ATP-binding protein
VAPVTAIALEVTNIAKHFGGLVALRDVSFRVNEGEVMGLIGPNGAGKSTLFEIVSGNLAPSDGRIAFFGRDCTADPAHLRRRAGLCRTFQKVRLFESMTVAQNIAVSARQCVEPGRDWRVEVDSILRRLRLDAQADRMPSEITLADRKKVEIGRAVAGFCRVLMLDESLSGLTHEEAEEMIAEILALNRDTGITVIVVEHVLSVLAAMVKRLVVLNNATVIADGTPTEIAHDPVVVAAYLGTKASVLR